VVGTVYTHEIKQAYETLFGEKCPLSQKSLQRLSGILTASDCTPGEFLTYITFTKWGETRMRTMRRVNTFPSLMEDFLAYRDTERDRAYTSNVQTRQQMFATEGTPESVLKLWEDSCNAAVLLDYAIRMLVNTGQAELDEDERLVKLAMKANRLLFREPFRREGLTDLQEYEKQQGWRFGAP
jgi:hypothetical protein